VVAAGRYVNTLLTIVILFLLTNLPRGAAVGWVERLRDPTRSRRFVGSRGARPNLRGRHAVDRCRGNSPVQRLGASGLAAVLALGAFVLVAAASAAAQTANAPDVRAAAVPAVRDARAAGDLDPVGRTAFELPVYSKGSLSIMPINGYNIKHLLNVNHCASKASKRVASNCVGFGGIFEGRWPAEVAPAQTRERAAIARARAAAASGAVAEPLCAGPSPPACSA
jgi:hypothetical protein